MTYAATTSVTSEQSRGEIERTLARYGATRFAYGWDLNGAMVSFAANDRTIRFVLPLPDRNDRRSTHHSRGARTPDAAAKEYDQAVRARWRALNLVIKAKLEAVATGITTFEDEFLAQTVLPTGETVGQWAHPQLSTALANGSPLPMLQTRSRSMNRHETADTMHRYTLDRQWDRTLPTCCFVMLNPSTANGTEDDPTIRRCIGFARRLDCGSLHVVNLHSYRATKPSDLYDAATAGIDTSPPRNRDVIRQAIARFGRNNHALIAAWGANATHREVSIFTEIVDEEAFKSGMKPCVLALGFTKAGQPRHPLMLRSDTPLKLWSPS